MRTIRHALCRLISLYSPAVPMTFILLGVAAVCLAVQLYVYLKVYGVLQDVPVTTYEASSVGVTVIIAARNEAANLKENLPAILNQRYHLFEVIVVNHASTDDTSSVLSSFGDPRLRVLHEDVADSTGKRRPLSMAVQAASYDRLLLTDADCRPASDGWLASMVSAAGNSDAVVIGHGPLRRRPGILNGWARFDNLITALQFLGLAVRGRPYMGVGRNLSYTRTAWNSAGGFGEYTSIGGDDDLLVNRMRQHTKVNVNLDPLAFCYSEAPRTLRGWLKRKVRHLATARHLDPATRWRLGIIHASHILFFTSLTGMLFTEWALVALGLYTLRLMVVWPVLCRAAKRLDEQGLCTWAPMFDLGHALYLALLAPALFAKPKRWT